MKITLDPNQITLYPEGCAEELALLHILKHEPTSAGYVQIEAECMVGFTSDQKLPWIVFIRPTLTPVSDTVANTTKQNTDNTK